jgi:hypothetical protein
MSISTAMARWQEQLKQVARTQRATILRHRDIVAISLGRIPMGPHALRYSEAVLAILRAGGVPDWLAVAGQQLLIAVVNGFTLDEVSDGHAAGAQAAGNQPTDGQPAEGHVANGGAAAQPSPDAASRYLASLPAAQFPNITALAGHYADVDPDQRFELLLGLFVGGLARHAAAG